MYCTVEALNTQLGLLLLDLVQFGGDTVIFKFILIKFPPGFLELSFGDFSCFLCRSGVEEAEVV